MEPSRAELDERTLAMVRDQAINAARRASEEYFSGQLPGLEEQVIQVAESAARHVLAGAGGGRAGASGVDTEALRALEQRVDNLFADKQLRSMVQKMVREERAAMMAIGGVTAPPERSARPGGFGRLLGRLLLVIFLLAVAGAVVLYVFPDTPFASALRAALDALVQRAQQRS